MMIIMLIIIIILLYIITELFEVQNFLIASHELSYLFKTILVDRYYYYYPHYTDLETKAYINLMTCQYHDVVNG